MTDPNDAKSPTPSAAAPKRKRRRWWLIILVVVVIGLFTLAMSYLHLLIFLYSLNDHAMTNFPAYTVKDSYGHTIRYFELKQTNAEWNLVYIHGTPGDASAFRVQFDEPFPNANLLALERPGFVDSKPARRRPSLADQADALSALLTNSPPHKTILIGHSYGGPIAVQAALKFTNQVAGVILIGGSVDPAQEHVMLIQRIGDWPIISWILPRAARQCNRELITLKGDLIRLKPQLANLSVPVLMLHGEKDNLVPFANVAYMRAQLDAAGKSNLFDALTFPAYNHFIPWEHPDAVAAATRKLISDIQQQSKMN
ncbi:MAG TPA: alpha/beta hydrolase [Verrucomicrobiae bacterium]|jgi:pimeloyl-ACP methyl ester carboxylesterase|nr:alpha/beta hydrolase [Verrucomicrobiae bacterium]